MGSNKQILLEEKNGEYFVNSNKIDIKTYLSLLELQTKTNDLILNHNYKQYSMNNGLHCLSCGAYNINPNTVDNLTKRILANLIKETN